MSSKNPSTENDAAIARALQEREEAEARHSSSSLFNTTPRSASAPPIVQGRSVSRNSNYPGAAAAAAAAPPPNLSFRPQQQQQQQQQQAPPPTHMCQVPCVLGNGVCVEMLVDTGAQSSVISAPLARQLNLMGGLDRRYQGVASGVGQAIIRGKLYNVGCELGHVEFPMDFIVLEVPDNLLLLGLDLMRRYKCIVDLERDVLIFGGHGGVEVTMLPAQETTLRARQQLGCPMM